MTENPYDTTVRPTPTGVSDTAYGSENPYSLPATDDSLGSDGSDSTSVKDKASDTADAGKQAASDVAQHAAGQAKDVAAETKKQARDLVGEARGQLNEQAGTQHRNLVINLRSLADELSNMGERSENSGTATELVSQAGDRAHGIADWLDKREPSDLLGEVRTFAQQRPGAFLFGAVVAGVVAGRLTRGAVAAHSDDSSATGIDVASNPQRDQLTDGSSNLAIEPETYSYTTDASADGAVGFGGGGVAP